MNIDENIKSDITEKKQIVFIDSNLLISNKYNFDGSVLKGIINLKKAGKIEIWTSIILEKEMYSHYVENINENLKQVTCKDSYIRQMNNDEEIKELITDFNNAIKKKAFDKYKDFFSNCIILELDNIDYNKIFDAYFSKKPPFSAGKKKSEFPDAFAIESLKQKITDDIFVNIISSDGDWKNAFSTYENVTIFDQARVCLDTINSNNEISQKFKKLFKTKNIMLSIYDELFSLIETNYEIDGYYYDRKGVVGGSEIEESYLDKLEIVAINNPFINNITENKKIIINVDLKCQGTFICEYFNEEESVYDSEEKDYIYRSNDTIEELHEFIINCDIFFEVNNEIIYEDMNLISSLRLDRDSLISGRLFDFDDSGFKYKKSFVCPNCHNSISHEMVSISDYCSWEERNMGVERTYDIDYIDICKYCNQKYRIKGNVIEYPALAFNYDDTKISFFEEED